MNRRSTIIRWVDPNDLRCKNCYAPLKSGSNICEYCGTAIVFNKRVAQQIEKDSQRKASDINEQMRNYQGSTKYQNMMRGEKPIKEPSTTKSSNNLGCLRTIFEFIIYAVILSLFPDSFSDIIVSILLIYWAYRFLNYIRNLLK